jgi:hypothetical protein
VAFAVALGFAFDGFVAWAGAIDTTPRISAAAVTVARQYRRDSYIMSPLLIG